MLSNEKRNSIATKSFIRGRKLKISLSFITEFYFAVPKNIRLNSTHYFIRKIPTKQELHQIVFNHSSDTGFEGFMNLYKNTVQKYCKPYSFLVIDTNLASDNPLHFKKNLLERI